MGDWLPDSDPNVRSGPTTGRADQEAPHPGDGREGIGGGPASDRGQRHRPGKATAVSAAVLVLLACGIGFGIGYAIHKAPSSPSGTTLPQGSPVTTGGSSLGASDVSAIVAEVAPALVNIGTTLAYEAAQGAGTGMVVTSSGRVVTNNHVIAGATSMRATDVGNGRTYTAEVVGYDVAADVAVLQLQGASHLATVKFSAAVARLGETVVGIGNAGGTGNPTAATGIVTGLDQTITAQSELTGTTEHLTGLIETNAAIQSGQSGGPLVNTNSKVLGMVTAGSANFALSQGASQGYAIPTATFRSITHDVVSGIASSTVHIGPTAFLGVRVTTGQTAGALVVQVVTGSPAAGAGIAPGDRIVAIAGRAIVAPDTLSSVLSSYRPGASVGVTVVDQVGGQRTVPVTLVAGPPA